MSWARIPKQRSTAPSVSVRSPSVPVYVPDAEPWSLDPHSMSPSELMEEVIDHVKRLRAEVATLRADIGETREDIAHLQSLPPYFQEKDHSAARGNMTGTK